MTSTKSESVWASLVKTEARNQLNVTLNWSDLSQPIWITLLQNLLLLLSPWPNPYHLRFKAYYLYWLSMTIVTILDFLAKIMDPFLTDHQSILHNTRLHWAHAVPSHQQVSWSKLFLPMELRDGKLGPVRPNLSWAGGPFFLLQAMAWGHS